MVSANSELHLSLPEEFANRQVQVAIDPNVGKSKPSRIYDIADPVLRRQAIETWLKNVIGFIDDVIYLRPEQPVMEFVHDWNDDENP